MFPCCMFLKISSEMYNVQNNQRNGYDPYHIQDIMADTERPITRRVVWTPREFQFMLIVGKCNALQRKAFDGLPETVNSTVKQGYFDRF